MLAETLDNDYTHHLISLLHPQLMGPNCVNIRVFIPWSLTSRLSVSGSNDDCQHQWGWFRLQKMSPGTSGSVQQGVRGGPRAVCQPPDHGLRHPHPRHLPPLPPVHCQGGPGVRESRHLQVRSSSIRRSFWSRSLLCDSLHGYLCQDWHENCYVWNTTSGGTVILLGWKSIDFILKDPDQGQRDSVRERHHVLQGERCHSSSIQGGWLWC